MRVMKTKERDENVLLLVEVQMKMMRMMLMELGRYLMEKMKMMMGGE